MAQLDTLLQEKAKMEESNSSLEEDIHSLRYTRSVFAHVYLVALYM